MVRSVIAVGVADSWGAQKKISGHNYKNPPSIAKKQGRFKISIEYAEEHLRQLTVKARHGVDITFPPAFGKPLVNVWRGSFFVARFSDAVRVRLTVDGKSVQGRVVADGKTAVEALHRLFASYACTEEYASVEVVQFHSNEPRVFIPDEARYETRFLEITDPSLGLNR